MAMNLADAQTLSKDLEALYATRNQLYTAYENIMRLQATRLPKGDHVQATLDPSPRNALRGAVQLMTPTYPSFHVARDTNNPDAVDKAELLERMASTITRASDRATGKRLHVRAATSALLYSQIDIAIMQTEYIAALMKGPRKARIDRIAKAAPLLFEVMHPGQCYPLFDIAGLASHSSKRSLTVGDVRGRYGEGADVGGSTKDTDRVWVWEYWDAENHLCWVDGAGTALNKDTSNPHEFIPIISHVVEGGDLFDTNDPESRQPMLYTVHKSGLWAASNINLTLQTTMALSMGNAPEFIFHANMDGKEAPPVNYNETPVVVEVGPGEDYRQNPKQVIDPSLSQTWQMYQTLTEQSTMFRQSLGQPIGSNAPYSMVSLLNQAGRLPLAPYQEGVQYALAMAVLTGFDLLREQGKSSVWGPQGVMDFDPKEIPEVLDVTCNLKLDQPSDERQNAVVAVQLVGAGLATKEWAMEKILQIEQPKEMLYQMYVEKALELEFQKQAQAEAMQQAQAMQLAQGQGQPQGQPQQAPGMVSPEMMGQMPQGGQMQGNPADAMAQLQQAGQGMPMAQPQDIGNGGMAGFPGGM